MKTQEHASFLIGLIGSGIGNSLTPPMHEHEGRMQGMQYIYRIIDLETLNLSASDIGDLLQAAERMGYTGLNITHPCKQSVVEHLDELSELAAQVGAVNTVVFDGGRRIGDNTDAWGFMESFNEEIAASCDCGRIVLLGAGGAGTAIAHALMKLTDCSLQVIDVDPTRASKLVDRLAGLYGEERILRMPTVADAIASANGIVNATPVGMRLHPGCPIDVELLRADLWVADIVYVPLETELVKSAARVGCKVMTGGGMAVYQAVRSFKRFTGINPDIARMKAHFSSLVKLSAAGPKPVRETA